MLNTVSRYVAPLLLLAMVSGCDEGDGGGGGNTLRLNLSWDPNPPGENVHGYAVFVGPTPEEADTEAVRIAVTSSDFNPASPSTTYELSVPGDAQICVRIKAYNGSGDSGFSDAACATL